MGYLGGRPSFAPGAGRHARDAPRSLAWVWAAAAGALASGLVFLLAHGTLGDAAHLVLAHARTLTDAGVWGAQPQLPDNAATSPLTVVLLAGLVAATGRPVLAVGVLLVVTVAATGATIGRIAARLDYGRWPPVVTVSTLTVNPLLVATIGTETPLAVAILGALGLVVLDRRPLVAGLLGGLLLLARADLVAFAVAGIVAVLLTCGLRAAVASLVVTAAVGVPWSVAAGIPDTLLVTMGANALADPLVTTLAVVPAAMGLLVLLGGLGVPRSSPRAVVLGAFAALVVVTSVDLTLRPGAPSAINGDLATPAQYRELAGLAPPGGVVASFGQAGTLAYYCGCTVVDPALDGSAAAAARAKAGPLWRVLLSRREARPPHPTWRFAIEAGVPLIRPVD